MAYNNFIACPSRFFFPLERISIESKRWKIWQVCNSNSNGKRKKKATTSNGKTNEQKRGTTTTTPLNSAQWMRKCFKVWFVYVLNNLVRDSRCGARIIWVRLSAFDGKMNGIWEKWEKRKRRSWRKKVHNSGEWKKKRPSQISARAACNKSFFWFCNICTNLLAAVIILPKGKFRPIEKSETENLVSLRSLQKRWPIKTKITFNFTRFTRSLRIMVFFKCFELACTLAQHHLNKLRVSKQLRPT